MLGKIFVFSEKIMSGQNFCILGKFMICTEKFLYIKKNYAMSGKIFVCPENFLRLPPPPRSPTFLVKEILISGCSHSAKFTLTPPPPNSKRCSETSDSPERCPPDNDFSSFLK
jgi:hypothetical protein